MRGCCFSLRPFLHCCCPSCGTGRNPSINPRIRANMFSLENKITLVTGASSGIGQAVAEVFARAGGYVFVADRDARGGTETVQRIQKNGGECEFVALDVT